MSGRRLVPPATTPSPSSSTETLINRGQTPALSHKRLLQGPSTRRQNGIRQKNLPRPPIGGRTTASLGVPKRKRRLDHWDILAISLSCLSFGLAVIAVAHHGASWRLGLQNQLVVIGFLLSVMELCRARVSPYLYLHLEARFGRSTLQNYDGILMNEVFKSGLDTLWRLIILLAIALPIALSVGYKQFQIGGQSSMVINATAITGMPPYFGMFGPPGLQPLDGNTGISLYFNATLPFRVASSTPLGNNPAEPALPSFPHAYGFNTLLLNESTTALLDVPQADRLMVLQNQLAETESFNITSNVYGTVTSFNTTASDGHDDLLHKACGNGTWKMEQEYMFTYYSIFLLANAIIGDQSHVWVGFVPNPKGDRLDVDCTNIRPFLKRFDTTRQLCRGTWSVTRGGIQLLEGQCDGVPLPSKLQSMLTMNTLVFADWYTPQLHESLEPFATRRNHSAWLYPSMTTSVAAMSWSRVTALNGAGNSVNQTLNLVYGTDPKGNNITVKDVGLMYPVPDEVVISIRPTLRKSWLLYVVLAVQPLLVILMVLLTMAMKNTPIGRGFGLVSILAGIEHESLGLLEGASLSGEVKEKLRLSISPVKGEAGEQSIRYSLHRRHGTDAGHRLKADAVYS